MATGALAGAALGGDLQAAAFGALIASFGNQNRCGIAVAVQRPNQLFSCLFAISEKKVDAIAGGLQRHRVALGIPPLPTVEMAIRSAAQAMSAVARHEAVPTSRELPARVEAAPDPLEQLTKLAALRDAGVITDEDFQAKKADLLSRI